MSSYVQHAPKHRASKARRAPKAALKTSLTLSSMAVVATGFAIGAGSLGLTDSPETATTDLTSSLATDLKAASESLAAPEAPADPATTAEPEAAEPAAEESAESGVSADTRAPVVTRSSSRVPAADPKKLTALDLGSGNALTRTEDLSDEDPRDIAQALLAEFGFSQDQFGCLDSLWTRESGWNPSADNPSSSAYGIPQALPGSKMSSAGADWATNPVTQIRWGLGYIQDRYGSPCSAWGHSQATGFY